MPLSLGDKLGPYEILAPIGAGGMGDVYKARDTRLDRTVAIKVSKTEFSERFEREAKAIAQLNHPHICQIYDIGPNYLVMEYIEGRPFSGPLPPEESVRLAIQVVSALEEAHAKTILHRDLKPGNILVGPKGVKLLDFGLAKELSDTDATQTLEGMLMGTIPYMAPEQAEGKPVDVRSEVFSLGSVLYEVLAGQRAFGGLAAVVRDEPLPLKAPETLRSIVAKCLKKSPAERYQSMAELKAALQGITGKADEEVPSIAVLPFANMSADKEQDYFSDGLAEEILNGLAQVKGLKVIARTSSFAFRGKEQDITKIAETLRVGTILEGSVRRAGSRLRVTAQLIDAVDGSHLWSQRYDRDLTDVFAVQDEIAAAIAGALKVKLTGKPAAARPHEPNLPAYEAFLKGRHQHFKLSPEAFARAEEYFKEAIALDPRWADPHSELGAQYFFLGFVGLHSLNEMMRLARAETRKALELLPSEPTAHAVLGAIAAVHDYDWKEAEEQFRLAGASQSLPPEVHDMYALYYLLPLGRFEEAIEQQAKAIAQDPSNAMWRTRQALALVFAEMYERAIIEARKAIEFDDRNHLPHFVIALSYFFQGKPAEARGPAEEAFRIGPFDNRLVGFLAGLLAQAGETTRAEKLIATIGGTSGMILYHVVRSEIDAAIEWYERDIELRQPFAAMNASSGIFKSLRASSRWPKLAKMMNLPGMA